MCSSTGLQKHENKKARNESNKGNPYAGTNNYHCLGFPSRSKHSACCPLGLPAPVFYRLGHPPSFHSGVFPTAVINYFALYSEAGSLPRLKLRTAYAFFLTIRRSGFTDGRSPGERKAGADKPEGRQAECFEREVNPRQPTANPLPQAEKTKHV